jgi:hypothetical protein
MTLQALDFSRTPTPSLWNVFFLLNGKIFYSELAGTSIYPKNSFKYRQAYLWRGVPQNIGEKEPFSQVTLRYEIYLV